MPSALRRTLASLVAGTGLASAALVATALPASADIAPPGQAIVAPAATPVFSLARFVHAVEADVRERAMKVALAQVGKPYVFGADGPDAFDCSGLTQFAYRSVGIDIARNAAVQADTIGHVDVSDLRPGDLVFFGTPVEHVGIYIGGGRMVDAPHTGALVRVEPVWPSLSRAARVTLLP